MMLAVIAGALAAGALSGAAAAGMIEKRRRQEELKNISEWTEWILDGVRIPPSVSGQETMLSRIEHQMIRVQEMLWGQKEAAEHSRDEIKRLISEIAHQMRTPLTNLETYTGFLQELLEEEELPGAMYVSAIQDSQRKLKFLTENFIKMSRLEQQVIQLRKEEKDLAGTVRNALGYIQSRAREKQIDFQIFLLPDVCYPHDRNWMEEAIYNLLDNGVKYTETGGKIKVEMMDQELFVKIRIKDNGPGIQEGEEALIFQRFYRGKKVTAQPGFGIGLYLSREIIRLHGGMLTARRLMPGLELEICLPKTFS